MSSLLDGLRVREGKALAQVLRVARTLICIWLVFSSQSRPGRVPMSVNIFLPRDFHQLGCVPGRRTTLC